MQHSRHVVADSEPLEFPLLIEIVDSFERRFERDGSIRTVQVKHLDLAVMVITDFHFTPDQMGETNGIRTQLEAP